ncbi:MAG: Acetate permease ActP (cation/acetate symporter) [uncultured Thiotrichaceae bacterium]|uniref:Acetate permease ActP (Cation/acetate symporter) n=1 Tax=uncultured Thiotrichaceae bacterium TaxID=298394 RepID=A0A6S6T1Z4_9GAMM|nr:MAG: Acetate permease ActP (cation/acetate symporter) [uncultured Thiotrichaceae bacterium]
MSQYAINMIFVLGSFGIYFGIAVWARAGSTSEFYAAGRGVHPVVNGMATAADWMSAASFISMAGLIAGLGYAASPFLMGWTGGYVLLALLLAPYLRKFGKFTVPEFIGDRFYSNTARTVAVVCLIIASLTYVLGQMTGVGVAFSRFLEVDKSIGIWIGAAIVVFYAVLGGMKGVTYTQVAQYVVLIIAYSIPAIFISLNLTGNFFPQIGLIGDVESGKSLLAELNALITELGFKSYTDPGTSQFTLVLYTLSLMIGTAGLPHVIIRFFTVPKVSDARWSAGWALLFIALLYTQASAVGAMARYNVTETIYPGGDTSSPIRFDDRPQWMKNWEVTGLLKFEDKNNDGLINYTGDKATNELDVNRDIITLANPEIANLPAWVIGLIAAGGIAAALSTAAGLLLAISSAVSHDLIKAQINPGISEKGELMWARISMVVTIVFATYIASLGLPLAAQTVALAFGLAAASIFPALMMGIFSKRINNVGAIAGMLAGISTTLLYIFLHKGWFFIASTAVVTDGPLIPHVPDTAFGAIGALINFVVAVVVSNATKEPPAEIQELVESVRVPAGAGAAVGH